jgi:hypothetical protein
MEDRKRMACPLNEFSEHMTGDMPDMDITTHLELMAKESKIKWIIKLLNEDKIKEAFDMLKELNGQTL